MKPVFLEDKFGRRMGLAGDDTVSNQISKGSNGLRLPGTVLSSSSLLPQCISQLSLSNKQSPN